MLEPDDVEAERLFLRQPCKQIIELCDGADFTLMAPEAHAVGDGAQSLVQVTYRGVTTAAKNVDMDGRKAGKNGGEVCE